MRQGCANIEDQGRSAIQGFESIALPLGVSVSIPVPSQAGHPGARNLQLQLALAEEQFLFNRFRLFVQWIGGDRLGYRGVAYRGDHDTRRMKPVRIGSGIGTELSSLWVLRARHLV